MIFLAFVYLIIIAFLPIDFTLEPFILNIYSVFFNRYHSSTVEENIFVDVVSELLDCI